MSRSITACVEVGASSVETVVLSADGSVRTLPGAVEPPPGAALLIAVPGLVEGDRVLAASNLGWYDVDPAEALGLHAHAELVSNDAEAAALGESVLRDGEPDLVFVGLGTGVGGAVVQAGQVSANLFAHQPGFSDRICTCTQTGCLETVAGGWALPPVLASDDLARLAVALGQAVDAEPQATPPLVVLAGGMTRAYPGLLDLVRQALPARHVEASAATTTKSAAAWGLRALYVRRLASVAQA